MDAEELSKGYGIGLTGGIATGKSTVAAMIRQRNFLVIDADQLARDVVAKDSPALRQIEDEFGPTVINSGGGLCRKTLGEIIFNNDEARRKLEAITHPLIYQRQAEVLQLQGLADNPKTWFYEASLLFESGSFKRYSEIWVTYCPRSTQLKRLRERNQIDEVFAQKMLDAQMSAAEKKDRADFAINTNVSLEQLETIVDEALQRFLVK